MCIYLKESDCLGEKAQMGCNIEVCLKEIRM